MTLQSMIQRLIEKGYNQSEIARMVEARGVKCPPCQIHRILHGRDPYYSLGDAIRRTYMDHCEQVEAA